MGNKGSRYRKGLFSILWLVVGIFLVNGCATSPNQQIPAEELEVPIIESIGVSPARDRTVVEITNDRTTHFTAFQTVDPPRIILDIRGKPGSTLPEKREVGEGHIDEIAIEKGKTQAMTTMASEKATASSRPGITPARNMAPTDCSDRKA